MDNGMESESGSWKGAVHDIKLKRAKNTGNPRDYYRPGSTDLYASNQMIGREERHPVDPKHYNSKSSVSRGVLDPAVIAAHADEAEPYDYFKEWNDSFILNPTTPIIILLKQVSDSFKKNKVGLFTIKEDTFWIQAFNDVFESSKYERVHFPTPKKLLMLALDDESLDWDQELPKIAGELVTNLRTSKQRTCFPLSCSSRNRPTRPTKQVRSDYKNFNNLVYSNTRERDPDKGEIPLAESLNSTKETKWGDVEDMIKQIGVNIGTLLVYSQSDFMIQSIDQSIDNKIELLEAVQTNIHVLRLLQMILTGDWFKFIGKCRKYNKATSGFSVLWSDDYGRLVEEVAPGSNIQEGKLHITYETIAVHLRSNIRNILVSAFCESELFNELFGGDSTQKDEITYKDGILYNIIGNLRVEDGNIAEGNLITFYPMINGLLQVALDVFLNRRQNILILIQQQLRDGISYRNHRGGYRINKTKKKIKHKRRLRRNIRKKTIKKSRRQLRSKRNTKRKNDTNKKLNTKRLIRKSIRKHG